MVFFAMKWCLELCLEFNRMVPGHHTVNSQMMIPVSEEKICERASSISLYFLRGTAEGRIREAEGTSSLDGQDLGFGRTHRFRWTGTVYHAYLANNLTKSDELKSAQVSNLKGWKGGSHICFTSLFGLLVQSHNSAANLLIPILGGEITGSLNVRTGQTHTIFFSNNERIFQKSYFKRQVENVEALAKCS